MVCYNWYLLPTPRIFWVHDLDLLGSGDVIDHVTIRLGIYGALYAVSLNLAPDPVVDPTHSQLYGGSVSGFCCSGKGHGRSGVL